MQSDSYICILLYAASDRPHMKELNRFLTEYCEFWKSTGLKLGMEPSVLGVIDADNRQQQRECFRSMLYKWLQKDVNASWYKLELAITNAKREYNSLETLEARKSIC